MLGGNEDDVPQQTETAHPLQVTVRQVGGGRAVFVAGSGDDRHLAQAARVILGMLGARGLRVVNVDQLLLTDTVATRAFLAHLLDGAALEQVVLCCNRLTGRKLLRRWGGDDVAIFASTADALRYADAHVAIAAAAATAGSST